MKIEQLHSLIGTHARYQGALYEVIEILDDGPSVVLQDCEHHTTIQADQHGEAHRRVPETLTLHIPLLDHEYIDPLSIGLEFIDADQEKLSMA